MYDFFYSLGEKIEDFFSTTTADIIGIAFLIVSVVLILFLLWYYDNK